MLCSQWEQHIIMVQSRAKNSNVCFQHPYFVFLHVKVNMLLPKTISCPPVQAEDKMKTRAAQIKAEPAALKDEIKASIRCRCFNEPNGSSINNKPQLIT